VTPEPRQDLPIPLPVRLLRDGEEPRTVYAVNVSEGGLCLHLREPLPEGEVVRVEFTLPPDGPHVEAEARVVWSGEGGAGGTGHSETGVRFETLAAELRDALHDYATQPKHRRR